MRAHKFGNGARPTLALTVSAAAGLVVVGLTSPAQAVPAANDHIEDAVRITAVPSTFAADTAEATARRSDGSCVGGQSVWYRYRPVADERVWLSTLGSDYDTLLAVFTGTRTNRTLVACNDDRLGLASAVRLRATAGTTYWIAVSSCCGPGGAMQLNTFLTPPPPGAEVTVTSATTGAISGRLVLNGTAQCDSPSVLYLELTARQRVGANVARGADSTFGLPCWPDQEMTWRLRMDSDTGWAFQDGVPALVEGSTFNSDGFRSVSGDVSVSVTPTSDPLG